MPHSQYPECRQCREPYVPSPKSTLGLCGLCKTPKHKPTRAQALAKQAQIEEFWNRVKSPDYYTAIRHKGGSSLKGI